MRPLLALVAILKDEASNIRKTLESVRPFVDRWTVLDTGSTDGTQDLVREVLRDLPGNLFEEPFVDFATSRNRVLDLEQGWHDLDERGLTIAPACAAFNLMLSGDEVLEGGEALRAHLETKRDLPGVREAAYCVQRFSGSSTWPFPLVLRSGGAWRYAGDPHEVPRGPGGELVDPDTCTIPGVRVVHTVSDPERRFRRMREYDLPRLEKRVADKSASVEERSQAIWFLAQTHEAVADAEPRVPGGDWLSHKMAAMALYWRRSEIGYDPVKAHYAIFRYLNVAESIGFYNDRELVARLEQLVKIEPRQPETRYMLAAHWANLDARKGAFLAEEAVRVARAAREKPGHMPTDTRVEWLALRIAAACAKELGAEERMRASATRGIAAGGPAEAFAEFLPAEVSAS